MTRKTRQRGHQWSDEFGVKGRRTGLVLKDLNIDPKGMPDVDALFESTMELEDEGERTQKSPMPVVKHKRGKKVNGHRGISNTRLPFQEDGETSRGLSFTSRSSSSLNKIRQSIGALPALNITSELAAAQSSKTSVGCSVTSLESHNASEPLKTYASSASRTRSQTTAKKSITQSKGQTRARARKNNIRNEQAVRRSDRLAALSGLSN
ncbi:hypothetical protein K456DRAFT_1743023 [Colletotrichum gloeosporioides 23]|nr:hypothetical protein K456DRAFT_1743023 [Colletotrichum gloeosporioides 23]